MHKHTCTHTQTQMLRVMKWWRRGKRRVLKRKQERIAFAQYTPGREGVSQREIVEGQTSEGGGMGEDSGDGVIRMSIPSVEKWREWHIERGTTPMWMWKGRCREKRIFEILESPWQRHEKEWGKTNHSGLVRADDCRGVQTTRALGGQGLCWRAGESLPFLHLITFVLVFISSASLLPLHGPLLLVGCHYVTSQSCYSAWAHTVHMCTFYSCMSVCTVSSSTQLSWSCLYYPAVMMPECDSRATCRLLIYTYWCGPGTLSTAVYIQPKGQSARSEARQQMHTPFSDYGIHIYPSPLARHGLISLLISTLCNCIGLM